MATQPFRLIDLIHPTPRSLCQSIADNVSGVKYLNGDVNKAEIQHSIHGCLGMFFLFVCYGDQDISATLADQT